MQGRLTLHNDRRTRRTVIWVLALAATGAWALGCGGNDANHPGGGASLDATAGDGGVLGGDDGAPPEPVDAALTPGVFGGTGGTNVTSCLGLGAGCTTGTDCCSGDCVSGVCRYPSCTSDHGACTTNGNCCSQTCTGGTCAPLNTTCRTQGNACTSAAQCCSGLCAGGACQPSSFCGRAGDSCATGSDCCTGSCSKVAGASLGTCGANPPSGPANCGIVDGQLCGGLSADGGVAFNDAGLPACGGPCCSRACAPWGPTGALVCQPASGCHVVGDLCTKDSDCCGSAGLPGGSGKAVTCDITAPATVGICRNPMGCKPDGDVCKLQTMSCTSTCNCCSGDCETTDSCKQDNMGVPRCAAPQCVAAGGACASSANCCGGNPCVPNPFDGGAPPYVCSGQACIAACGACTDNADCCAGTSCVVATGSTHGVCGPCGGGSPGGSDGGIAGDGGPGTDGGGSGASDAGGSGPSGPTCALYGQICTTTADCCDGIPCQSGRCQYLPQ